MTSRYSKLVGSDMYRDGGSFEAKFLCADGGFETIWLEAAPDSPRDHTLVHSHLQIYRDLERTVEPEEVKKGSAREAEILKGLREFLSHPTVDVPFAHKTPDRVFLDHVEKLVHYIQRRESNA